MVRHPLRRLAAGTGLLALLLAVACASPTPPLPPRALPLPAAATAKPPAAKHSRTADLRAQIVRNAEAMLGHPYRYGGASPAGFDCSGLVVYSYRRAGVSGLPRTARDLEARAQPIRLSQLRPGDLLFFHLDGAKARHVAIYVGDDQFIHAPSSGKGVELVAFDDVYWGRKLERAGRLLP